MCTRKGPGNFLLFGFVGALAGIYDFILEMARSFVDVILCLSVSYFFQKGIDARFKFIKEFSMIPMKGFEPIASLSPKFSNKTARIIPKTLMEYPNIILTWKKAHAGYEANETADMLAKQATRNGSPYLKPYFLVLHKDPFQETNDRELVKGMGGR
ncbi:hypothetical protein AVEN_226040-1 [Araneus ventricosus]|uniref:RNase H type-1 domain-containing protein n=1 Tax=Araneus ventricosus TaxID=182803 RepID=A0A4Y2IJA3_ARAVE|nr:hypothetical protein AVEN_226040-1 [Araneus ventricosus]